MSMDPLATWDYLVRPHLAEEQLNTLGAAGWELVGISADACYLKRRRADFKERVTLDQKERYYALWGMSIDDEVGGAR